MKKTVRIFALFLLLVLTLGLMLPAAAAETDSEFTVLFTHDLHSHLLPALDENGDSYGGYARLMTVLQQEREKSDRVLYVDGGDFSAGSLFQTSYKTSAVELRVMAQLGVDVTTFGNHEYDEGPLGLAQMLRSAMDSGDALPTIVETNYLPQGDGEGMAEVRDAFERYGVEEYVLLEKDGVWFAVFSSYGINADEYAPTSGMTLLDRFESAKETVQAAREECYALHGQEPVVVCLSHSGTEDGKGEDNDLAKKVDGIDIIISGHTHTTLQQPIVVNDTYIVSAGCYASNLGSAVFTRDREGDIRLKSYNLLPVNDSVTPDETMEAAVAEYKTEVERDYLSNFGMTFDQVLVHNDIAFESQGSVGDSLHESTLCDVFSDAYKWAAEQVTGDRVDVAITAEGVIRESLPAGDITVSDVFTAASLGTGNSELPGGTLLSLYITGKDLKDLLEVDASVTTLMREAQLFCSGIEYKINTGRMFFNRAYDAYILNEYGYKEKIENDKLYHIVAGSYAGNMLGTVGDKSYGLLNITPRDKDGNPLDPTKLLEQCIVDENGRELKEWYAIATYLQEMGGEMDESYAQPDGRKIVLSSYNPVEFFKDANRFTFILVGIVAGGAAVFVILLAGRNRRRRKKAKKESI